MTNKRNVGKILRTKWGKGELEKKIDWAIRKVDLCNAGLSLVWRLSFRFFAGFAFVGIGEESFHKFQLDFCEIEGGLLSDLKKVNKIFLSLFDSKRGAENFIFCVTFPLGLTFFSFKLWACKKRKKKQTFFTTIAQKWKGGIFRTDN